MPRSFFTKVAGVTHEGRQRIVARCSEGERLLLVREPNNPVDEGAVKIMRLNGEHLGYVAAHVSRGGDSSGLAAHMDRGRRFQCRIKDITGGGEGRSLGVNIEITEGDEIDMPPLAKQAPVYRAVPNNGSNEMTWLWLCAAIGVLVIIGLIVMTK